MSDHVDPPFLVLEVRERKFQVTVDNIGRFSAEHAGRTYYKDSFEGLRVELMRVTKQDRVKMNIPFTTKGAKSADYTCTGRHSSNGNLMIVDEGEHKVDQWSSYSSVEVMRPLSGHDKGIYRLLLEAQQEAERAVEAFEKPRTFNLREAVDKVLQAAMAEED